MIAKEAEEKQQQWLKLRNSKAVVKAEYGKKYPTQKPISCCFQAWEAG